MVFHSKHNSGSALLISILLMSFVIVFGLGISSLIVDSVRVERNVVEAGKAYFAAEGAAEKALYVRENSLLGYSEPVEGDLDNKASWKYNLVARESIVPCSHRPSAERILVAGESISLPLFYGDDRNSRVDGNYFSINYVLDFGETIPQGYDNALRWKVLGLDNDGDYETESVSGVQSYGVSDTSATLSSDDVGSHYDQEDGPPYVNDSSYPISAFLDSHIFNYLVLMNLTDFDLNFTMNADDPDTLDIEEETTCEYSLIEADGFSNGAKQSIDVQVKLDTFLPVFDFVLYQTS